MKILICEDDAETGRYLSRALLGEGHLVDLVETGRLALVRATASAYDFLIIDRICPKSTGSRYCARCVRRRSPLR